jgi:RNA polymerase sigma factor, sigma-70 family
MTARVNKEQLLLEKLFNRYFSHLVLYARKLVGEEASAEDIVQDLFLRLYENDNLERVTPSFLFVCVKNASLNYLSSARQKQVPLSVMQEQIPDEDIHENVAYMERLERLDAAIESLPDKCKEVFILVYLKQQRYEDVATQLNISYHTVKAHMTTAFKHIRKNLLLLFFFFQSVKLKIF